MWYSREEELGRRLAAVSGRVEEQEGKAAAHDGQRERAERLAGEVGLNLLVPTSSTIR